MSVWNKITFHTNPQSHPTTVEPTSLAHIYDLSLWNEQVRSSVRPCAGGDHDGEGPESWMPGPKDRPHKSKAEIHGDFLFFVSSSKYHKEELDLELPI